MSTEQNKAIGRREHEEIESKGNMAVADEILTPNYVLHFAGNPPLDREGYKQLLTVFRTAFPDMRVTVEDQTAEGDRVVNRVTMRGTHTGEFQGIPPTGKQVMVSGINIMRIEGGKIVEHWGVLDVLGLMQQLGAIPSMG